MAATTMDTTPPPPSVLSSPVYPFAASPDIIRSNQKDTYEIATLSNSLTDVLRRLYGSRFTHTYSAETDTLTSLLYLSLTTLIGNRTLGEEYTDVYQIEAPKGAERQQLPAVGKRAGYILLSVLFPYALNKTLPALRARIRRILERNLATTTSSSSSSDKTKHTSSRRIQAYLLTHLSDITSPAPIHALTLTIFYFTGSYYHLSKRLFGLRYIFSKRLSKGEEQARVGYEVLGVLLVVQMVVQGLMHARSTLAATRSDAEGRQQEGGQEQPVPAIRDAADSQARIAVTTHTPLPLRQSETEEAARYDLADAGTMGWIQPQQQRKCTLCLEPMKDPSVTTCGHVFCWTCILEWVREKPECPLCRQEVLGQHVLPLRG